MSDYKNLFQRLLPKHRKYYMENDVPKFLLEKRFVSDLTFSELVDLMITILPEGTSPTLSNFQLLFEFPKGEFPKNEKNESKE